MHHTTVDADPISYPAETLVEMKRVHEAGVTEEVRPEHVFYAKVLLNTYADVAVSNERGNVAVNSPGAMVGTTTNITNNTIKPTTKKVAIAPPEGTIGAYQRYARYIAYLIERYNKFASVQVRERKFSYGALGGRIESKFGAKWRMLPEERFEELRGYLQTKIQGTIVGKRNTSEGRRSFLTFEEYGKKHER